MSSTGRLIGRWVPYPLRARTPRNRNRIGRAAALSVTAAIIALYAPAAMATVATDSATQTTAAPATDLGIRLLDMPLDATDDPRAHNYVVDHVAPGTMITRRFVVSNNGSGPFTALLYPVAAAIVDSRFVPAPGRDRNELTSWITVDRPEVELDDVDSEIVSMTIAVPVDAPHGEHYGVVFAERPPVAAAEVGISTRVGIRVYLSVGTGSAPTTDFEIDSIIAGRTGAGEAVVTTTVTNTGGRAIDLHGDIALSEGPNSTEALSFTIPSGATVAPGASGAVETVLEPGIDARPWLARVRLRSGLVERTAEAEIRFPAVGTPASQAFDAEPLTADAKPGASSGSGRSVIPWAVAGLVLLIGVGAARLLSRSETLGNKGRIGGRAGRKTTTTASTHPATATGSTIMPTAGPPAVPVLLSSAECVEAIARRIPYAFSLTTHAVVARNLGIRPPAGQPHRSLDETCCHYDRTTRKYQYTRQWVDRAVAALCTVEEYRKATGREPTARSTQPSRPVS